MQSEKLRILIREMVSSEFRLSCTTLSASAKSCPTEPVAGQKEKYSSWALFILIMLLIAALFASYMLQHKKIQAVHETVLSIFAGM